MPADLHLFSTPGKNDIRAILDACRPYLAGKSASRVAYLPLASLYAERWQEQTEEAFRGLARLDTVNAELMTQAEIEENFAGRPRSLFPAGTLSCCVTGCI